MNWLNWVAVGILAIAAVLMIATVRLNYKTAKVIRATAEMRRKTDELRRQRSHE